MKSRQEAWEGFKGEVWRKEIKRTISSCTIIHLMRGTIRFDGFDRAHESIKVWNRITELFREEQAKGGNDAETISAAD